MKLVKDSSFVHSKKLTTTFEHPNDVARYMTAFAAREIVENLWVLPLDLFRRLIGPGPIHLGAGNTESVAGSPRALVQALLLANANSCVLVHNHPGGIDASPSDSDLGMTQNMVKLLNEFEIELVDHIIVTDDPNHFTSLRFGFNAKADYQLRARPEADPKKSAKEINKRIKPLIFGNPKGAFKEMMTPAPTQVPNTLLDLLNQSLGRI